MDRLSRLCSFLVLILIFAQNATVNGSTNTTENDSIKGIIGAIVDKSSRIGKDESVDMKMALEDFYNYYNQRFVLHVRNSRREPIQAAFEGNKHIIFLLAELSIVKNLRYRIIISIYITG